MRNCNKAILFLGLVFVLYSCNRFAEDKTNSYIPPTVTIDNEIMCIIEASQNRVLRNLMIRDVSNNRIIFSLPSLDKKRIIILHQGEYSISADGVRGANFKEDCRIIITGNAFSIESLRQPRPSAPIAFRRGNNYVTDNNNLIARRASYYLTILDMENLLLPAAAYSAEINGGIGSIPLKNTKESNQRIVSENPVTFERGNSFIVTVTVNTNPVRTFELPFRVIDPPPEITINNLWRGSPLQFAEMEYFRLGENETLADSLPDNVYMDRSRRDGLLSAGPNGEPYVSTENDGKIVIDSVPHGGRVAVAVSGYPDYDPEGNNQLTWYIKTIRIDENNPIMTETWNIPSKGGRRAFRAFARESSAWNDVVTEDDYHVSLYYQAGVRSTIISRREVLSDSTFTRVRTPHREINNDMLLAWFDLDNVSIATQLNYLIRLDSPQGNFSMTSVTFERSPRPELVSE